MTAPVLDRTTPTVDEVVEAAVTILGVDPAIARAAVNMRRRQDDVELDEHTLDRVGRIMRRGDRR